MVESRAPCARIRTCVLHVDAYAGTVLQRQTGPRLSSGHRRLRACHSAAPGGAPGTVPDRRSLKPGEEFSVKLPRHRCPVLASPSAAGGPPQLPGWRGQRLCGLLRAHGQQPGGWPASTWEQQVFREGSWLCSDQEGSHVRSAGSKKGRGILPNPGEPQRVSEPSAAARTVFLQG